MGRCEDDIQLLKSKKRTHEGMALACVARGFPWVEIRFVLGSNIVLDDRYMMQYQMTRKT